MLSILQKLVLCANFQCELHHFVEGVLTLLGGKFFACQQVVGDCANAKRLFASACGVEIECGGFHFYCQNTHLAPNCGACTIIVECVACQDVANFVGYAHLFCLGNGLLQKVEGANWSNCAGHTKLVSVVGVCACALAENKVAHLQIWMDCASRTNTDDVFYTVEVEKFVTVDTDGWNTHTACHNGNALAVVKTCVALYATYVVYKFGISKVGFCNKFCAEWIAGHQNCWSEIAQFCGDVWGWDWHRCSPP